MRCSFDVNYDDSRRIVVFAVAQALALTIAIFPPPLTVFASPTSAVTGKSAPPAVKTKTATSTDKPANSVRKLQEAEETHHEHKRKHRDDEDEEHHHHRHHRDNLPNFRSVRQLESLTPAQQGKINQILAEMRDESLPLARKLRSIREETYGKDISVSREKERSPEAMQIKKQLHAVRKEAWLKMQRVLTAHQKIELEARRGDDFGPRRRDNFDARPESHDSGKSFSK